MKKILALAMALCLVLGMAACGQKAPAEETAAAGGNAAAAADEFVVDVFIYNFADTYVGTVRDALETEIKGMENVTYQFHDGQNSQETQSSQIDSAIARGTDLLVVNIVEPGSGEVLVNKAKDKDLPIIFFNAPVDDAVINSYEKCAFIGTDPDEAGYMQGKLVADLLLADGAWDTYDLNGDGSISYVMLRSSLDNKEANGRTKYSVQECNRLLTEAGKPELVQIGSDENCEWASDKAKIAMDTFLTSNPFGSDNPIECVFANNDDMALGAIQALNTAGYNTGDDTKIIVVGVDATATAQDAITRNQMSGSVKQDGAAMAHCIATFIANTQAGKTYLEGTDYAYIDGVSKVLIPYSTFLG